MRALTRADKLLTYRHIVKLAVRYPSKNRVEILEAIHDDFATGRTVTDEHELAERWKRTRMLLAHLKMYDSKMKELQQTGKLVEPYAGESINSVGDKDWTYF
jgi:hypothetical protein